MKYFLLILVLFFSFNSISKEKYIFKTEPEKQSVREIKINENEIFFDEKKLPIIQNKTKSEINYKKIEGALGSGRTCFTILQKNKNSPNGIYTITPSDIPFNTFCDMTNGGWSLLSVQVPEELLGSNINNINIENFGHLDKTHRVGNNIINSIRPYFFWKLEDSENNVYFRPHCIINWSNDLNNNTLSDCNKGYKDLELTQLISDVNMTNYSNGIGISNEGKYCSIRMFLSRNIFDKNENILIKKGTAFNCNGDYNSFIRLWFK